MAGSTTIKRMLPIAVIGTLLLAAVGVLNHFHLIPGELLVVIIGPGLLLGALVAPDGIHSDTPYLFFGLTAVGTIAWWYFIGKFVLTRLQNYREKRSRPR